MLRRDPNNASAWAHLRGLLSLPNTDDRTRQRLRRLITDVAASHITILQGKEKESWLFARELLVDLQMQSASLLGLVRAKRLVERTLGEAESPVLAVRRGYWEVRVGVGM
jgi:hypothetical protein